jgi:hypothetical protein
MKPTAHQCDLLGVHWAKVSDSAVFRVLDTQLHVAEYSTSQTATLIPRSIRFVLFEPPLNAP